jgi:hypothetical protein
MRIHFTSVPVHSHIMPLLPLMHAAQYAGHNVAMATGADALVHLERAGIDGFACGPPPSSIQESYAQQFPELIKAAASLPAAERFINYVVHAMLGIYVPADAVHAISLATFRQSAQRVQAAIAAMPRPAEVIETLVARQRGA